MGNEFTVTLEIDVVPFPQVFVPLTEMVPFDAPIATDVVIILLPVPDIIVNPEGNNQL